jgi:hypothetical protein
MIPKERLRISDKGEVFEKTYEMKEGFCPVIGLKRASCWKG